MSSHAYYLGKYSTELNLVLSKGWQFDDEGKVSPSCKKPLTKIAVLNKIYATLQNAPVYSLNLESSKRLIGLVASYATSAESNEAPKAKKTALNIQKLIMAKDNTVFSCFHGLGARKINTILDKDSKTVTPEECSLLTDLANLFAQDRLCVHNFYQYVSFLLKMQGLIKNCPSIKFIKLDSGETSAQISYLHPVQSLDCQLALEIEWHQKKNPDLLKIDAKLIKKMISRKLETPDLEFKKYLEERLMLYIIFALAAQIDNFKDNSKELLELLSRYENNENTLNAYSLEFLHHPESYIELSKKAEETWTSPFDSPSKFVPIVEELRTYENTNESFNKWYRAIYKKIIACKQIHQTISLPFIDPDKFVSYERFIKEKAIKIPLSGLFAKWEKEAQIAIEKSKEPTVKVSTAKKQSAPRSKAKALPKSVREKPLLPVQSEIVSPVSMKGEIEKPSKAKRIPSAEEGKSDREKPLVPVQSEIVSPVSMTGEIEKPSKAKRIPSAGEGKSVRNKIPVPTQTKIAGEEISQTKSWHQLLEEASPFAVHKRVTDWFDPSAEVKILNEESFLVHNFAWAANTVAWEVGTHYLHLNAEENCQPAIAILCDVEHSFFPKPELFLMTFTFDHLIDKRNFNPEHKYDPKWSCFHRALTRRDQQNEVVDEYMEIAKKTLIDFPPLPSQVQPLRLVKEFDSQPFPDGSFIESVRGGVVTIRDPKQDTKQKKCRIRLFIIQYS